MGEFLTPVLALILWTFVMWMWMYKRRIPAMQAISKDPQDFINDPNFADKMPMKSKWPAENYNHLHEQPVIFYALMFYLHLTDQGDNPAMYLAWAYVAIRIVHSLVQVTNNKVMTRFSLFVLGTLVLMIMAARAVFNLF